MSDANPAVPTAPVPFDPESTSHFGRFEPKGFELRSMWDELIRTLGIGGIPPGMLSLGGTRPARCGRHLRSFGVELRLREETLVRIAHCGCDSAFAPKNPPPIDPIAWARRFADEILRYWMKREAAFAMMAEVTEAVERELARLEPDGTPSPTSIELVDHDTCGRRAHAIRVGFDLLDDSMLGQRWNRKFDSGRSVSAFFRSMRPVLIQLRGDREALGSIGARGGVDALAVEAMRNAGMDPLDVLAQAAASGASMRFRIDDRDAILRWRRGVLEGEMGLAPGVTWHFGRIRFAGNREVGRPVADAAIGTFISSPLLRADAPVRCTLTNPVGTTMVIDPEVRYFRMIGRRAEWLDTGVGSEGAHACRLERRPSRGR